MNQNISVSCILIKNSQHCVRTHTHNTYYFAFPTQCLSQPYIYLCKAPSNWHIKSNRADCTCALCPTATVVPCWLVHPSCVSAQVSGPPIGSALGHWVHLFAMGEPVTDKLKWKLQKSFTNIGWNILHGREKQTYTHFFEGLIFH